MKRASFTFVIVLSLMVASTVLGISARIFTVGGIVKKQDGAPVQGLEVTVVNETMGLVKRSKTGKSGEYAVIFIDYEGGIVVKTGDVIKVTVKDTEGNLLSESSHVVSEDEVKSAKTLINLTLNYPPALEPIEDKNVEEGKLLEFNVSATDPDEDKLVFSAEKLPKGATFKEGKFSWKPGFDQAGEYHVVFKVSDGKGGEDTKRVKITVTDVNRKPELSSIGARNIREGERLEFTVSAIDPDKDDLSFSAEGLPDGAKFEDGVFTWTPTYEQAGTYSITFIVSDGKGGRDIEKVEITVMDVNRPPELSPISDKSVKIGQVLEFTVEAIDPDRDELTFSAEGLPKGASFSNRKFSWQPSPAQIGEYYITFKVSDGKGGEDSEEVKITVLVSNYPPVLTPIGSKRVKEGETLQFTVEATDKDGDTLTFSAEGLPKGASFTDGKFSWTPSFDQAGTYHVTFKVSDGKDGQDSEKVEIIVEDVNRKPILETINAKSIKEGELLQFTLSATDPDGDSLIYSAEELPEGASFSDGKFSWKPTYDQAGIYHVTFKVSDGKGGEDSERVEITVKDVNRSPVLTAIGSKSVKEGETLEFILAASDPDKDNLVYSVEGLPEGASFIDGKFSWRPSYDQAGTYYVTFKVTDGKGGQDSEKVEIAVENVNRKPILKAIGTKSVKEGELLEFALSATDPDGDSLIYSAEGLPKGAILSDGKFSWKPSSEQIGEYHVTFKVSDGNGGEDSEDVRIIVGALNRSPVLAPIGSKSVREGEPLQFTVEADDEDGDALTFSAEGLPEGANFTEGKFSWKPGFEQSGEYLVTFKVSDGKGGEDSEQVKITVQDVNRDPILTSIEDKSVKEGELLRFQVSGSDPDGDPLTFSAEGLPKGAMFSNRWFNWKPDFSQSGIYHVTFKISDGKGGEDSERVEITVKDVNRNPVLAAIGSKGVKEGETLEFILSASDPDKDNLVYSAEELPKGASFIGRKFSWTPDFDQAGEYLVTFKVSDGRGGEDSEQVRITVQDANRKPKIADIGDKSVKEGELLQFTVNGYDPDGDPLTFSAENLPKGAAFLNRRFIWRPKPDQVGVHKIIFKVSDGKGGEDATVVKITVIDVSPPLISHTPLEPQKAGEKVVISAEVKDFSELKSVKLLYRAGGESEIKSVEMRRKGELFSAEVEMPQTGLIYCIIAEDLAGNKTIFPKNGIRNPIGVPAIGDFKMKGEMTNRTFHMISIPLVGVTSPMDVLSSTWGNKEENWVIGRWNGYDYERNPKFQCGWGYWVNIKESRPMPVVRGRTANPARPFPIPLQKGWNQIGNPFPFPVYWGNVRVAKSDGEPLPIAEAGELVRVGFWYWRDTTPNDEPDGSYEFHSAPDDVLIPWLGYWVKALQDNVQLIILPLQEVPKGAPAKLHPLKWHIELVARDGHSEDRGNLLGVADDAEIGDDPYDIEEPPPPARRLDISFLHGDDRYSVDIRPEGNEMVWELLLTPGEREKREVALEWSLWNIPPRYHVYLEDLDRGIRVEMKRGGRYKVRMDGERKGRMRVRVSENRLGMEISGIIPRISDLMPLYPNPANPEVWIPFTLSESAEVEVRIYDISGRLVRRLALGRIDAGVYLSKGRAVHWDGRNESGERVASGMYLVELRTGKHRFWRRLSVVK